MKGLPLTYSKDMQEDKEQVFDAADNLMLALAAMSGMVADMTANRDSLKIAAASGFSTATDLADWLVRALGMPFRDAHHVTGSLVAMAEGQGCDLPDLTLAQMQSVHRRSRQMSLMCWVLRIQWPRACPTAAQPQNRCAVKSRAGRRFCHEISAPLYLCMSVCLRCRWITRAANTGRACFSRSGRVITGANAMRHVFLGLAIWGAIHPMYYFLTWFRAEGWSLGDMVQAWHVNAASSGLVWDLTIAATALSLWIIAEVIRNRKFFHLIAIAATFCIGVSCGLPLYLYLRSTPEGETRSREGQE